MIGNSVNKSGYLLSGVAKNTDGSYSYKGVKIKEESMSDVGLQQYVYVPGETASNSNEKNVTIKDSEGISRQVGAIKLYPCKKINGVKYYIENIGTDEEKIFTMINDEQLYQSDVTISKNDNAIKYYENAYEFTQWVKNTSTLMNLTSSNAYDANGNPYSEDTFLTNRKIFNEVDNDWRSKICIEDENSNFNAHRIEVIKNSIETNLMVAISNYNNVSDLSVNFQMPKLQDTDWEELTKNISMITFLQGLSIGGKVYNGYSIVRNDITEDFVSEDSIYMCYKNTNKYYKVTDTTLLNNNEADLASVTGIFNVDFERKSTNAIYKHQIGETTATLSKTIYYYPRADMASYGSIINSNNGSTSSLKIQEYLKNAGHYSEYDNIYRLAQIYYTALGRERYGMYRVTNYLEKVQEDLIDDGY